MNILSSKRSNDGSNVSSLDRQRSVAEQWEEMAAESSPHYASLSFQRFERVGRYICAVQKKQVMCFVLLFFFCGRYMKEFNECAKIMMEKWEKKLDAPIEVSSDIGFMTLDTILRCAMSQKTNCQQMRYAQKQVRVFLSWMKGVVNRVFRLQNDVFSERMNT